MRLFGRKSEDEVDARPRSRPRAEQAPPGWVTVQALVDRHEQERTSERVKLRGTNQQHVYKTATTYALLDPQGQPFEISVEQRLRAAELPKQGERLTVAYDPQEPSTFV